MNAYNNKKANNKLVEDIIKSNKNRKIKFRLWVKWENVRIYKAL